VLSRLNLEILDPGVQGDPTRYQCVIGHKDRSGGFVSCLTVAGDGTVTVFGDLRVQGVMVQAPAVPDPNNPQAGGGAVSGAGGGPVIDITSLQMAIDGSGLRANQPSSYKITLTNTGVMAINSLLVEAVITVGSTVLHDQPGQNIAVGAVGSGANRAQLTGALNLTGVAVGTSVTIILTALGLGQGAGEVFASASLTLKL